MHFVGIGGVGMGGIAKILIQEGFQVSGSDLLSNVITKQLLKLGAKIYYGHNPENVIGKDVVVISSAISLNNLEILEAKKQSIPVIKRAEILIELMRFRYSIAISGTHGKTTTTAMIANIYQKSNLDPTIVNGGLLKSFNLHANLGKSSYLIMEVDESDASLLYLKPIVVVITNIEKDHMENYNGNFDNLKNTFINFVHNIPFYGYVILCIDDPIIRQLRFKMNRKIITYGFSYDADWKISNYKQLANKSSFLICCKEKKKNFSVQLNIPGLHNSLNATAAIALSVNEGIQDEIILQSMKKFRGISRRFDNLGLYDLKTFNKKVGKVIFIDDYGHHPTEIYETIKTVKTNWPTKRLVMIFQPHRYTRTYYLFNDFVTVLSENTDILLILNTYSAGEKIIPGYDSISLYQSILKLEKNISYFVDNIDSITKILSLILDDDDLVIIQGAGNVEKMIKKLVIKKMKKIK